MLALDVYPQPSSSETNMAYRTADHLRWQQMDFVVGQHVLRSNNREEGNGDICEMLSGTSEEDKKGRYPKDFKFVGWHPWCRCHVVPLLADDDEFEEYMDRKAAGEDVSGMRFKEEQTELPEEFKEWVRKNEYHINASTQNGKAPYFVRDNRDYVDGVLSGEKKPQYKGESPFGDKQKVSDDLRKEALAQYANEGPLTHIAHNSLANH